MGSSKRPPNSKKVALVVLACSLSNILSNILITDVLASDSDSTVEVPVEGSYVNSQFGIEITFAKGWQGSSNLFDNNTVLYLTLTKKSGLPELGATDLSSMTLSAGKDLSSVNLRLKVNPLYENCIQIERSNQTIAGKDFTATITRCPTIQYKTYHTQTPVMTLNFTYSALPSAFEAHLEDFENSIRTIIIR